MGDRDRAARDRERRRGHKKVRAEKGTKKIRDKEDTMKQRYEETHLLFFLNAQMDLLQTKQNTQHNKFHNHKPKKIQSKARRKKEANTYTRPQNCYKIRKNIYIRNKKKRQNRKCHQNLYKSKTKQKQTKK